MSIPIPNFWRLLQESRLLAPEQCQQLALDFSQVKGASEQGNAKPLAGWLVARNVLSRYQAMILLAGRSGPFFYGEYKVYDRIEQGQLKGDFRAVHLPTGHPVLLQFLTGPVSQDPAAWAEAFQNALAGCTLHSPHVQRFFEPVDLGSFKFLVSEDLRGVTLDERLAAGRLPPQEACRLIRQAALGVAQLHLAGRAHGDIRLANLFLDTSIPGHPGDARVLFEPHLVPGPINFAQNDTKLVAMSDYLAPELMQPGRVPDPFSDVYALGCALYWLLSGNPPFAGDNVMQKMTRHATEGVQPLEPLGVPPPLAQLVMYMLAKSPQVRYQSASVVADQLAAFVDPSLLYAQPPQPLPTQGNYEHLLAQKHGYLAAAAQPAPFAQHAPPPPPPPAFGLNPADVGGFAPVVRTPGPSPLPGFPPPHSPVAVAPIEIAPVTIAPIKPGGKAARAPQRGGGKRQNSMAQVVVTSILGLALIGMSVGAGYYVMNRPDLAKSGDPNGVEVAKNDTKAETKPGDTASGTKTNELNKVANKGDNQIPSAPAVGKGPVTTDPIPGKTPAANDPGTKPGVATPTGETLQVVADDGQLLWASPTSGKPTDFRMVPLEGQVFIVVRPAALVASPEGTHVLEALGPRFGSSREAWEKAIGLSMSEIDQLIITLHNNNGQFPRVSYVVHPKGPVPSSDLLAKWGNPAEAKEGDHRYFTGPQHSYFMADTPDGVTAFLMADAEHAKEAAASGGGPTLMHRDLERLRRSIDGDRHVNILFNPDFFDNEEGQALFQGPFGKVRQPLDRFLGDSMEAGLVSLQFDKAFYFEFRLLSGLDRDPFNAAQDMRERLKEVPQTIENYVVSIEPPAYWRKLSNRFPGMVASLYDSTRVGVEGDQAIVNAYLPGVAAHNLVLGGELLIASTPGAPRVAATEGATANVPQSIDDVLKLATSMTFDANPLEFCMRDLTIDVQEVAKGSPFAKGGPQELQIKIIGADLEKDGITRNQQVRDFKQEKKPIAEILTALVMKANPVTTVKSPDEADQKLLWVVGPDPDNPSKQMILITTRAAAATKKYTLPAVFQPKVPTKAPPKGK